MHQTENPSKIIKEGQPLKLVLSLKMERTARDFPSGSVINNIYQLVTRALIIPSRHDRELGSRWH
jgi:hypothetical protein